MKVYEIHYEDPRWRDSEYVSSTDESRVREHCEKLIRDYADELANNERDIEMMGLELPLEFRWDDNEFQVTDAGNVARSGKWHQVIAWASYEKLKIIDLDAIGG